MSLLQILVSAMSGGKPPIDYVIVLAGQSNSNGQGTDTSPPSELQGALTNVNIINGQTSNTFQTLDWPDNNKDSTPFDNGIGQELKLGTLIRDNQNANVWIVKTALGGTGVASGEPWEATNGSYTIRLKANWDDAQTYFTANNITPTFLGIVWVQGERDASQSSWANAYDTNCKATIDDLLTHFGQSTTTTKVIQTRLRTDIPRSFASTVRAKQELLATNNTNWYWVNTDDLTMIDSGLHYSMSAQLTIAQRVYDFI